MLAIIILTLTGTLTALSAGLLYAYSVSVNLGLAALSDSEYVHAMQSINRKIQNPRFFLSYFLPVVLLPAATFKYAGSGPRFHWFLAATLFYIIGTVIVTVAGNVPLNNQLDGINASSNATAGRRAFERPWNRLHAIRTLAATLAVACFLAGCLN